MSSNTKFYQNCKFFYFVNQIFKKSCHTRWSILDKEFCIEVTFSDTSRIFKVLASFISLVEAGGVPHLRILASETPTISKSSFSNSGL